jgi:drug/metabolite transporter (DMT)-like permease
MSQGVIYMLASALISAFSAVFAKIILVDMSLVELSFFRNLIGVFIVSYFIYKNPIVNKTRGKPLLLLSRAVLGILGMFTYFYAIATLPLGVAITLNKTSPIFGALFSFLLLKEKLNIYAIIAMFIGFFGIVFISNPISQINIFDTGIGVLSGLIAALAYTSIRAIKDSYDTKEIVLAFAFAGVILSGLLLFFVDIFEVNKSYSFIISDFIFPDNSLWVWIILLGFSGTAAQFFMTKAYECEKTGIVGTVAYSNIPFAVFLGIFLGDKFPNLLVIVGIVLIIISGILISNKGK